jgi:hypothetical protein
MMDAKVARPDIAAWTMREQRLAVARTVLDACEAESIAAIPVKGIVTSALLYDDPTLRPMFDVDVRVTPEDHARVRALIEKKGWRLLESSRVYKNHTIRIDGVEVDLEGFIGPRFVCWLTTRDMIARATWSDVLGFRARIPDFTDHVVLLLVNVFKDKLELARPWAIGDLVRIRQHAAFDVRAIAARVREARVPTIAWIVADWLVRSHDAREWTALRDALEPDHDASFVRLFHAAARTPDSLFARIIARSSAERRRDRVRAVALAAAWELEHRVSSYRYRDS